MTTVDPGAGDPSLAPPARANVWFTLAGCAVVCIPFLVAAVALRHKPWFPTSDLAQAELRMRSFWSDPPLLGAAGRLGTLQDQGHHPGPMLFWFAWPVYALLGRTAWAYETSVLVLDAAWVFLTGLVVRRRGGNLLVAVVLLALAVTVRSYHADALSQPWNPYMALLPFFCFLVVVWGVLCDDLAMLPLAVFVGTYCIQCHVGYLAIVGGLLALAVGWQVVRAVRVSRGNAENPDEATASPARPLAMWVGVSVVVGVVSWIPPVIEQFTHHPGNMTILWRYFTHPPETPVGLSRGLRLVLMQLSPVGNRVPGLYTAKGFAIFGGLGLLVAAVVLAAFSARLDARLLRLYVLLGVSVVLAIASSARIFGEVWGYLLEWMWSIAALIVVAVLWSIVALARKHSVEGARDPRLVVVPVVGVVAVSALFAVQATSVEPLAYVFSQQEAILSQSTLAHVDRNQRYLVVWEDPIGLGGTGFGLLLQLTREGYQAGIQPTFKAGVPGRYVFEPGGYDQVLHVVTGLNILPWRADPAAKEVACADLRTPDQRTMAHQLETKLTNALRARGLSNLLPELHANLFALILDPRLPSDLLPDTQRLGSTAETVAVFRTPAGHMSPSAAGEAVRAQELTAGTFGSAPTCT